MAIWRNCCENVSKNRAVPKEIISPGLLKCWNCGHIFVLQKNFHAKKTEFLNYSSSMLLKLDYTFFAISICSSYCNFLLNNEVKMFVSKEVRNIYFFNWPHFVKIWKHKLLAEKIFFSLPHKNRPILSASFISKEVLG